MDNLQVKFIDPIAVERIVHLQYTELFPGNDTS